MIQEFYSKLSSRGKIIFYITCVVVFAMLIDRIFYGPISSKTGQIQEEIKNQKISISHDKRILSYKSQIIKQAEVFDAYFTKTLKDDDEITRELLSVIEEVARSSEVSLIQNNAANVVKHKDYIEYYANVESVGPLEKIITFLHKINTTEDLIKVVNFNFSPKRGTDSDVAIVMKVKKMVITPDQIHEIASAQ
ncbi:MAG: type 4a pilus biogenesis protein PilO [Candidatus Omnitrophica bacterium]|nr:type 4a pilus biogenesis protein PilO [Candidatus Omnitrophota bacterium]